MCLRRQVDRTLTNPSLLPGRPSRAHDKAAKIPSCALPTPPRMQLRRNREFVSNPALLRRHLLLCLHTRVLHSLAASPQEPHPAAPARALVRIESCVKEGPISPPPEALHPAPYHTQPKVRVSVVAQPSPLVHLGTTPT
jgi:hypothetical protein